jgi:small subunit ribosomal protein S17e
MELYANENGEITMGNIRQNYIKALTSQLLEEHSDEFSTEFGPNKELVTRYTDVDSKVIRNRVAGYIVRQLRVKAIRKK